MEKERERERKMRLHHETLRMHGRRDLKETHTQTIHIYIYVQLIGSTIYVCVVCVLAAGRWCMQLPNRLRISVTKRTNRKSTSQFFIFFCHVLLVSCSMCISCIFFGCFVCWLVAAANLVTAIFAAAEKKNYIKNQQQPHIHVFGTNNNWAKWMKQYFLNAVLFK